MLEIKSAEIQVYEALRREILHGLKPGARLPLAEVAARYGVSTMPVRAALRRLEADGLVLAAGRRGHVVAPVDLEDLVEIQTVRVAVEGHSARLGAVAIDTGDLRRMHGLLQRLAGLPERADLDQYLEIEHRFRDVCYEASGRARLLGLVRTSRRAAERYIRIAVGAAAGIRDSISFQERLYAACVAHDGGAAETATREALHWTVDQIAPRLRRDG